MSNNSNPFNKNPFVQNTQNFDSSQLNSNFNFSSQNSIPNMNPNISPVNQNIPPVPPVPPMNPNFPPMPPMPQSKSSGGLVIAIVVVLVLLLVSGLGVGGFIYWNNLQKQQAIEKLSSSINNSFDKYDNLTNQTIKDLENLSKAAGALNSLDSALKTLKEGFDTLNQISTKHQELVDGINPEDQAPTKDFDNTLKQELVNAKQVIDSARNLYDTSYCFLNSLNESQNIFDQLDQTSTKLNVSKSIQSNIDTINQMIKLVEDLEEHNTTIINCLEKNPNFGSPRLVSNFRSLQQVFSRMKSGLELVRSGLQNNKIEDVERGSKMFVEAFSKLTIYQIDESSLPDVPKETEKAVNEYKQRVNFGKKNLEEKKKQVLEKVKS